MALQQSLGSLTASLFTPNRIGEYGAKAIYFKKQFRKRILLLNLIGNLLQMTVTVVFGIIGFSLFVSQYPIEININRISRLLIIIVVLLVFSEFNPLFGELAGLPIAFNIVAATFAALSFFIRFRFYRTL
ncbi:hypothetical protein [Lacinutrix sp.]|uniref:hypothetical protein n=1 Tax=Lacinutrix sp. TaxID=1937692 RepID=UPI0035C844F0